MNKDFWKQLPTPFFVLAPMANVTDFAFREIIATYGKPHVMITEFVSCAGLCSDGREKLLPDLWYSQKQRPIVAQIFGSDPKQFFQCAEFLAQQGFDGIDINMGCPDRKVEKQGAGAALINNPRLAQEIIRATKKGAPHIPVSVKTRIGYNTLSLDSWLPYLLDTEISALTIHGRTRKEMSAVPAHWDVIGNAVKIAKEYDTSENRTRIIGNGDVDTLSDALKKARQYGVDGVMIGRGVFGNPWLFCEQKVFCRISPKERFRVMIEHTELFEKKFQGIKSFALMKKHYKAYISGFEGAKELRAKLMNSENAGDVRKILEA